MHAARRGHEVALWANPFDARALEAMRGDGKHPALPEHLPAGLALFGPEDLEAAADGCETAILGANSDGARSLAEMVRDAVKGARFLVSIAKGLEPETGKRMSQVYEEEFPGATVVSVGGPCLAAELAEGSPSASVWSARSTQDARAAGEPLTDRRYQLVYTDDVVGVEYCTVSKNVAAIGVGILDGMSKVATENLSNAKAALFTKATHELSELVVALGGRAETAMGLAGLGDVLVTSLGGRNRLYGELVGEGEDPQEALKRLEARGMTVEGVASTRDVRRLAEETGLELPYHSAIHRVLFEGEDPHGILEVLC